MRRLRQLGKPLCWYEKATFAIPTAINYCKIRNLKTKRTLRQKKTIHPLIILVEVEKEASQVKLQVGLLRKILAWIREASEANPPTTLSQLALMLPPSRRTKSKVTRTWGKLSIMPVTKRANMSTSTPIKSQKPSVGLGNLRVSDWD